MARCSTCSEVFSQEIMAEPSCGRSYRKKDILALGLAFPIKHFTCSHCGQEYYLKSYKTGLYTPWKGKFPYVL